MSPWPSLPFASVGALQPHPEPNLFLKTALLPKKSRDAFSCSQLRTLRTNFSFRKRSARLPEPPNSFKGPQPVFHDLDSYTQLTFPFLFFYCDMTFPVLIHPNRCSSHILVPIRSPTALSLTAPSIPGTSKIFTICSTTVSSFCLTDSHFRLSPIIIVVFPVSNPENTSVDWPWTS